MRRSAAALAITVIGLWLVLTFRTSPVPSGSQAAGTTPPSVSAPPGPAPTTGAGPVPTTGGAPTTGSGNGQRSVMGDVVTNRYGPVQVAVILNANRITDVKALQLPFDHSRSREISAMAVPELHDEVIQAQSAQIDSIGGATYTSRSYAQSLQSALDKAHA